MMTQTLVTAGCTLIVLAGAWKVFEKMGEMLLPEIFVPVLGFGNEEYAGN